MVINPLIEGSAVPFFIGLSVLFFIPSILVFLYFKIWKIPRTLVKLRKDNKIVTLSPLENSESESKMLTVSQDGAVAATQSTQKPPSKLRRAASHSWYIFMGVVLYMPFFLFTSGAILGSMSQSSIYANFSLMAIALTMLNVGPPLLGFYLTLKSDRKYIFKTATSLAIFVSLVGYSLPSPEEAAGLGLGGVGIIFLFPVFLILAIVISSAITSSIEKFYVGKRDRT